ncbi:MAG: T9SS type A sorting domain-containing protein [Bacteroidota bacterium]
MPYRSLLLVALLVFAAPAFAQTEVKLTDPNGMGGAVGDFYGRASALSGDGSVALVGAENKTNFQGAAFVYVNEGGTWRFQAELQAPTPTVADYFGAAVALTRDGTLAFVTSRSFITPAVHVFERTGDAWTLLTSILPTSATVQDQFGGTLAVNAEGSVVLVGAILADAAVTDGGAAYVFTRSGDSWAETAVLTASDAAQLAFFGWSVALSGDGAYALVGNGFSDDGGAAYVFARSGDAWTEQSRFTSAEIDVTPQFGQSVALDGDGNTALVGASSEDGLESADGGALYVFTRTGAAWTQQARLVASDGQAGDQLGFAAALTPDGRTALAGANQNDGFRGAAYVFGFDGASWAEQAKLIASDGVDSDQFGSAVALSTDGATALVGMPQALNDGPGAAYVFTGFAVAAEEGPLAQRATLGPAYPNPTPAGGLVRAPLVVAEAQSVRVVLYDVLGRAVRAVDLGVVAPQQTTDVAVPTGGLAPGLYVLRAEGPSITASRRVVVR